MSQGELGSFNSGEEGNSSGIFITRLNLTNPIEAERKGLQPGVYITLGPLRPRDVDNPPVWLIDQTIDTITKVLSPFLLPDEGGSRCPPEVNLALVNVGPWIKPTHLLMKVEFGDQRQSQIFTKISHIGIF